MLGAEGELGDVLHGAVLLQHQDVVLPVVEIGQSRGTTDLYPPAPGRPSGTVIMGSIDTTIPGASTVSTSSLSSRP